MKNKKNRTVLGIVLIICVLCVVFTIICISSMTNKYIPSSSLSLVMNEEEINEANNIIKNCELEDGIITRDELLDTGYGEGSLGYRIIKDGIRTVMYIKDGEILCIKYADKFLYKDGEYLEKLSDYIITSNEKSQLIVSCENALNSILKSPSTAKYPWDFNEWKMWKENGEVTVQSYVDAQNSFGAMMRSQFQFKIKDGKVISLIFDGKEYIK